MMTLLLIILACFLTGILTLISGFGLSTLLTPFLTILYNVKTALLVVAIVHLSNNFFKLILFRKHIQLNIFKRFGLISLIGALIGASLFSWFSTGWLQKLLGGFLLWSGLSELFSKIKPSTIDKKWDLAGGFFSGFLGGLIGAQGAIRSAYLLNYSLTKEAFIATGSAISILIDLTRVPLYIYAQKHLVSTINPWLILLFVGAAFIGTHTGKRLLEKLSLTLFRKYVAITLIGLGIYFFF